MNAITATIFAIKRFALHDGPNLRTTIFFKGCPLCCHWCHNPEGIAPGIAVITRPEKCVGCKECVTHCQQQALQLTPSGIDRQDRLCSSCHACVDICPALAHETTGWRLTTEQLLLEIAKDIPFYDQSGGGVTFSGGEPLCQPAALLDLLRRCGELGIHRVVDSSGYAPADTIRRIAQYTDLFLIDLKHMDSVRHRQFTGVDNKLILDNLHLLAEGGHSVRVRIPLVPGVNDDDNNIKATGAFIAGCPNVEGIDILPYHPSATAKYKKLGQPYKGSEFITPTPDRVNHTVGLLKKYLSDIRIGG